MRYVIAISAFFGGFVFCYLLFSMDSLRGPGPLPSIPNDAPQGLSVYLSFMSVMLTAVTVVLTALGIGIGIIAAYTFTGLKTVAREVAKSTAKDVATTTSNKIAKDVAEVALSDSKVQEIAETYLSGHVRRYQRAIEFGPESEEEER